MVLSRLNLFQTSTSDLADYEAVCSKENMVISAEFKRKVFEKDELKQILDIEVTDGQEHCVRFGCNQSESRITATDKKHARKPDTVLSSN